VRFAWINLWLRLKRSKIRFIPTVQLWNISPHRINQKAIKKPVKFVFKIPRINLISCLILANVQVPAGRFIYSAFYSGSVLKLRKRLWEEHYTITLRNLSVRFANLNCLLLLRLRAERWLKCCQFKSQREIILFLRAHAKRLRA
jgi:hypothetical protein